MLVLSIQSPRSLIVKLKTLQINVDKVDMKAAGGEPFSTVMGQDERDEFPRYQDGAFVTTGRDVKLSDDRSNFFYLNDVVSSLVVQERGDLRCAVRVPGLTLMITRYEYCNAYHTMTDWFNAFLSLPDTPAGNVTVVFLDGHAEGKLDEVWSHLWGNVMYVKQLPPGGVCFDHVTFIPAGYASVLWSRGRAFPGLKPCPSMMEAFVKFVVEGYSLQRIPKQPGRVTIIDRMPYLAHPRSKPHSAQRMILNFDELARSLRTVEGVTEVQVVRFEGMTFEEQLRTIRETHILIGNHGAGISHLLFLQDDSFVLEFAQSASDMFVEFAKNGNQMFVTFCFSTLYNNVITTK
jgi:glycoprotein 2-beta-D-xylosyltransferase